MKCKFNKWWLFTCTLTKSSHHISSAYSMHCLHNFVCGIVECSFLFSMVLIISNHYVALISNIGCQFEKTHVQDLKISISILY